MKEIDELRSTLESHANPDNALSMQAYMKDHFSYFGIKSTPRREATKELLTQLKNQPSVNWNFVFECFEQDEREFQYTGIDYLRKVQRRLVVKDIPQLRSLILSKSWWDTVDALAVDLGSIIIKHPAHQGILNSWISDDNMWIRRSAIIHQLRFKEKTNLEFLSTAIERNLGSKEFFINKAIGWALRSYGDTDPGWVIQFVSNHDLAPLSKKEALRKIT